MTEEEQAERERLLEAALVHMWEFMPSDSMCPECQRIKDMAYRLMVKHAKKLDGRS